MNGKLHHAWETLRKFGDDTFDLFQSVANDPTAPPEARSEAFFGMGHVIQLTHPELGSDDLGLEFYLRAVGIDRSNIEAFLQIAEIFFGYPPAYVYDDEGIFLNAMKEIERLLPLNPQPGEEGYILIYPTKLVAIEEGAPLHEARYRELLEKHKIWKNKQQDKAARRSGESDSV